MASNAGEVEAQILTMRGLHEPYMENTHLSNSTSRAPGMLQVWPQFHDYDSERLYTHLKDFEDTYSIFQDNSCPQKVLLLELFLFTLQDKAKFWFNSLRPRSIHS